MIDITDIVVGALLGMGVTLGVIAWYVWTIVSRYEQKLNSHIREALDEVRANLVGLVIEEDGDQLYAYREEDRQFLCQGANIAEIREKFSNQYPDKTAYLSGGDPALIERLKTELAQIKEQEKSEVSHSV
jgi:hypothetical protein